MTRPVHFQSWTCRVQQASYDNGRIALRLVDEEGPVATATVNLPEEPLAADEVAIKTYSENEGMLESLLDAGIVEDTGRKAWAGRVQVPICRVRV